MIQSLTRTVKSWIGKYGSEASFVGRVAVAAFLPPGAGKLIESGLEAAFEYIQGKSDVIGDHELAERLDQLGVPREQLNQIVHQVDQGGNQVLQQAFQARQEGKHTHEVEDSLRTTIANDPSLSALRTNLESIASSLQHITQQQEVLIAGQSYQAAALEEMMRMISAIANQVGLDSEPSIIDAEIMSSPPTLPVQGLDAMSALASLSPSSNKLSSQVIPAAEEKAATLVERFYQITGRSQKVQSAQAVDLVARFQAMTHHVHSTEIAEASIDYVGIGKVSLCLQSVGNQPITVVKWLCEAWSYSLADAIITTQNLPCIIKRDDDFVALARAQKALQNLGAKSKLTL